MPGRQGGYPYTGLSECTLLQIKRLRDHHRLSWQGGTL